MLPTAYEAYVDAARGQGYCGSRESVLGGWMCSAVVEWVLDVDGYMPAINMLATWDVI